MFNQLRKKWNVSWPQFILIFCTFAVGGTITGKITSILLNKWYVEPGFFKMLLYIFVATPIWMIVIVITSIPFGQFSFFYKYVTKTILKIGNKKHDKEN
jgi:hypothetical protein